MLTVRHFESRAPAQITSSSKRIQFISYALGAALLLLVAVWWQRHYSSQIAPPADDPALNVTVPESADSPAHQLAATARRTHIHRFKLAMCRRIRLWISVSC